MSKLVPTPVAAALGLVPTLLDGVRRLPGRAVAFPVLAVSSALTALDAAKREYDELAGRGERLVARLRGSSLDGLADHVEDVLQGTPLATPYNRAEEATEVVGDAVAKVGDLLDKAAQKKPGSGGRAHSAATAEVIDVVEGVAKASTAPDVAAHDNLPLPDYDHMTLGSLRGRLRSLTVEQLVQIRDYERAHADRLPVATLLDNRIAKLATDETATLSPGGAEVVTPAPDAKGKVSRPAAPKKSPPRTKVRTS